MESCFAFSHGLPTSAPTAIAPLHESRGKAVGEGEAGLTHGTCGRILPLGGRWESIQLLSQCICARSTDNDLLETCAVQSIYTRPETIRKCSDGLVRCCGHSKPLLWSKVADNVLKHGDEHDHHHHDVHHHHNAWCAPPRYFINF